MTKKGAERLRGELDRLKSEERPRIIAAIAEARAHGDLKENAEYHAARELQGFIEGRIQELEGTLSHAEVIDVSRLNAGKRIVFGATVELADEDSGEEVTYQIVGDLEADIKQRLISVSSPFARADRQERRRQLRVRGAERHQELRNRLGQLPSLIRTSVRTYGHSA
jgi:transcription elongation factor GreA